MSLYVPLRQTAAIDLGQELRLAIQKDFFQSSSVFDRDLAEITNLRHLLSLLKDLEFSPATEKEIKMYVSLLDSILEKFPDEVAEFGWYLTLYSISGPTRYRSLQAEKDNAIFQLGAVYSQKAYKESRHSDEGLKRACGFLQRAAGCLQTLQNSAIFEPSTTACLVSLMLAEAQESFYNKAVGSGTKDTVVARLARQTAAYYEEAALSGEASDDIRLEWIHHMKVKRFHFEAVAHMRIATVKLDEFQYGEQVAHLKAASNSCKNAAKNLRYVDKLVLDDLSGLTTVANETLKVAEFDNDLVYLKPVPTDLKPIIGAPMVKPILPEFEPKRYFADLIPFAVVQVAQAFRERQDSFVRAKFVEPLNALINMMAKFLAERNLPASIDTLQRPESIPDSIIAHSQEILSLGGIRIIETSFDAINKLAVDCQDLVKGCQERLRIEADEDDILRKLQGKKWNREFSLVAGAALHKRVTSMQQYLDQAEHGDEVIWDLYETIRPYLEAYCGGFRALKDLIPPAKIEDIDSPVAEALGLLRQAVNDATDLTKKRKNFLHRLEIKARDNNILPKIIEEYKKNKSTEINTQSMEAVYRKHMAIFNEDVRHFDDLKQLQIHIEGRIDKLNNEFVRLRDTTVSTKSQRQAMLETLEITFTKYLDLVSNLNEGCKFYNDFLDRGSVILKECDDFLLERRAEGQKLEMQLSGSEHEAPSTFEEGDPLSLVVSPRAKSGAWNPSHGIVFE